MQALAKPVYRAAALFFTLLIAACATDSSPNRLEIGMQAASDTLARVKAGPHSQLYAELEPKAKARLVVSNGVSRAVASAHEPGGSAWSGPAFYTVTRLSAKGAGMSGKDQDLELVALIMTDEAMAWLTSPKLPGMADLQVADIADTGSSGSGSSGSNVDSDIILFDSSGTGLEKLGLSTILNVDADANRSYYGEPVSPEAIFSIRKK